MEYKNDMRVKCFLLPVSFIEYYNLVFSRWESDFFLRKGLYSISNYVYSSVEQENIESQ